MSDEAMRVLRGYDWPGNVRELQNALQRAAVLTDGGALEARHLPPRILEAVGDRSGPAVATAGAGPPGRDIEPARLDTGSPPYSASASAGTHAPPAAGSIPVKSAPAALDGATPGAQPRREGESFHDGIRPLQELEREAIRSALDQLDGNLSRVCRELGIGRTTLYRKLKKYELR